MAKRWVATGVDEYGFDTGYYEDDPAGYSYTEEEQQPWQDTTGSGTNPVGDYTNVQKFDDGSTLIMDKQGNIIGSTPATDPSTATVSGGTGFGDLLSKLGTQAFNALKGAFTKPDGSVDWKKVAGAAGGVYGLYQSQQPKEKVGYQGKVPKYTAVRKAVPGTYDPSRRPGSGGQRYFTNTAYAAPGDATVAAQATAKERATGLAALNQANPAQQRFTPATPTTSATQQGAASSQVQEGMPASKVAELMPVPTYAMGGLTSLAKGGAPRYLNGASDGMADKIPARIDGAQEARLSHGEFVIPADVVGHLGNGNSDAGAERLYDMMDKIRKARTGTTKQGKQINPNKFLLT
jgi:hypothetical protein